MITDMKYQMLLSCSTLRVGILGRLFTHFSHVEKFPATLSLEHVIFEICFTIQQNFTGLLISL